MNDLRITKNVSDYPKDKQAEFQCPDSGQERSKKVRFLLGRPGGNPLVVICMNPSAANKGKTDKTVSRIVNESARLGYNGWCIANVYPLRGTDSVDVSQMKFDDAAKKLAKENCDVIANFLREYNIKEVWGAWGDSKKGSALAEGKQMLLERLRDLGVKVFYYGGLTKLKNPRHPRCVSRKDIDKNKQYYTPSQSRDE